jgi:hypothetical protein
VPPAPVPEAIEAPPPSAEEPSAPVLTKRELSKPAVAKVTISDLPCGAGPRLFIFAVLPFEKQDGHPVCTCFMAAHQNGFWTEKWKCLNVLVHERSCKHAFCKQIFTANWGDWLSELRV